MQKVITGAILAIALIIQLFLNQKKFASISKQKIFSYFFVIILLLGGAVFLYLTVDYYLSWHNSKIFLQYLLPPYQKITYLLGYIVNHFAVAYLISLGVALVFLGSVIFFNERYGNRFFEAEEPYLGALSIFLLGPNYLWLYYLSGLILCYFLWHLANYWRRKKIERLPLYWLWLPAAILVIIIKRFFL